MESWRCYKKRLRNSFHCPDLTLVEKALVAVVLLMITINGASLLSTEDVGDWDQIRLAKLQAQQELMALKSIRE